MKTFIGLIAVIFVLGFNCAHTGKVLRVGSPLVDHYVRVVTPGGFCSGVYLVINKEAHVLTAAHCVEYKAAYLVKHGSQEIRGKVFAHNLRSDLALIRLYTHFDNAKPAKLASKGPNVGDAAYAIGLDLQLYVGNFKSFTSEINDFYKCSQVSFIVEKGMSGTGVFNSIEELVGIITHVDDTADPSCSYCSRWGRLTKFFSDVAKSENVDGFDHIRGMIKEFYGEYCEDLCPCTCTCK